MIRPSGIIQEVQKWYQIKSTSPLWGETTAATLLERSNKLPPSNATRSASSLSCLMPRSLWRLVDARAYACRLFTRPLDSKPAQVRSKRAFLAKSGVRTPIPTRTPAPCNFVMVVSDEIGGPGKILRLSQEAGYGRGEVRITPTFALAVPSH